MSITHIFFDTNDTLYHSPEFAKAQEERIFQQLSEVKQIPLGEAKELFQRTKKELKNTISHVTKVAVMMELGIKRQDMQEYLADVDPADYLQRDERLVKMIAELSQKYTLGIITNVLKRFVIDIVGVIGLDPGQFTHIVSVDNTKNSKPHPEPFERAIEYPHNPLTKSVVTIPSKMGLLA